MDPLLYAAAALWLTVGAYQLCAGQNELGHHWLGLISGVIAFGAVWTCVAGLLGTFLFTFAIACGIVGTLRIVFEIGFSVEALIVGPPSG